MADCQHIIGMLDGQAFVTVPRLLAAVQLHQGELSDSLERFDHCPRCGAEVWLYIPMQTLSIFLQAPKACDPPEYQAG